MNWNAVGGVDEKIIPFQRLGVSDSHTAMMKMVMSGVELSRPLMEESESWTDIVTRVATCRNYSGAIGYPFRFYAVGMKPNERIKLLAVDGVEPMIGNIKDGSCPLTVCLYAVTTADATSNTKKLIDWLLSEQGQRLIERCGYVPVK